MENNQKAEQKKKPNLFKMKGTVVSDKMDKTIVVEVIKFKYISKYKKKIKLRKKYKAHDEKNECKIGDQVEIISCRPLSREKRWRLHKKIEK